MSDVQHGNFLGKACLIYTVTLLMTDKNILHRPLPFLPVSVNPNHDHDHDHDYRYKIRAAQAWQFKGVQVIMVGCTEWPLNENYVSLKVDALYLCTSIPIGDSIQSSGTYVKRFIVLL